MSGPRLAARHGKLARPFGVIAAVGGILAMCAVQCGPSPQSPDGDAPAGHARDERANDSSSVSRATRETAGDADADGLPALSEEALAARVEAQRQFLGDDALFEDLAGRPVPVLDDPDLYADSEEDPQAAFEDALLDALPGSAGIGLGQEQAGVTRANGNALGLFVPLEDAKSPALAHFHAALAQLRTGQRERVNIAVYGASHTQADVYPGYMRSYFHDRFGNGGRGFIALTPVTRWYRTNEYEIEASKHWQVEHAQRRDRGPEGWLGLLGGSGYSSNPRASTKAIPRHPDDPATHASHFEIHYVAHPKAGKFKLYADGKKIATVNAEAPSAQLGRHEFELPLGAHTIEIRPKGDGEVRLLGMVAERDDPGVVVDTLGISGTRAANMLRWDESIWRDSIQSREPDLWTMFYGTNEATDTHQSMDEYRRELRQTIQRFKRAVPEASCVIIGPGDFPREVEEGVWTTRPRVLEIVAAQREIAYEMGCGFWDAMEFMGGPGSMHTWATSKPQMASRDHIHFTRRGYVRLAMAVTDAMMATFDGQP